MHATPTFLAPGAGSSFAMMGLTMTLKQTAAGSQGLLSLIEQQAAPGAGSPLHQCGQEDKILYVLEGSFAIRLGDDTFPAGPGSTALIPRGCTHNFRNIGDTPGRILAILTPGGHEHFLQDLSQAVATGGKAAVPAVAQHHGVTLC